MINGNNKADAPRIIDGGISIDDRGEVRFVNDFAFDGVKRFYLVSNHRNGFVRAWHAHRKEAKYVYVVDGSILIGAVKIDNWDKPSKSLDVAKVILSSKKPSIFYIPAGYANGFMSLEENTKVIFFSTTTMIEAKNDDIRYDARYWDIWSVMER